MPDGVRVAVGHDPGVAQQAGRLAADDHDVLEPAVGHRHLAEHDDVGLGPLDPLDAADAVDPALGDEGADVRILFFSVGEMLASPKMNDYLGVIAPEGQKALYMGLREYAHRDRLGVRLVPRRADL